MFSLAQWEGKDRLYSKLCQFRVSSNVAYYLFDKTTTNIDNHIGQMEILGHSFVPKRSKIAQEMAELWLFSH